MATDLVESNDPYRKTLRPRAWWRDAFISNSFAPTRSRYLWRSVTAECGRGDGR